MRHKVISLFIICIIFLCGHAMKKPPIRRVDNIIKPDLDKWDYRGLELSNRMKVLLVSDPTTKKSAAGISVNVGHMSDPHEIPGLAHFCEHMLFLGTKKYPYISEYADFVVQHGGTENAETSFDTTVYYFDVISEKLKDTLDRFAQFFISPLFTVNATEKELNAVHSEYEMYKNDDYWRRLLVEIDGCDSNHDYHKFGIGNRETLDVIPKREGISVRDELLKFHDKWYSSNIMALVILGRESLDELEAMVVDLFSEVKDKDVEAPYWNVHPYSPDKFKTYTHIVPLKNIRLLKVVFPTADWRPQYKSAPDSYLSYLMGHEGPGSLFSALKARGWCASLTAGVAPNRARGIGFVEITMALTENGLNQVNDIIKLSFQYVNMLKETGPLSWVHDEDKEICSMQFRFRNEQTPLNFVTSHIRKLHIYPFEEVLSAEHLISEWKPDLVTDLLNDLVPDKARIVVVGQKFATECNQTERWVGTRFQQSPVPEEILEDWRNAGLCNDLRMPDRNAFIPSSDLCPPDENITEHPSIIHDSALTRVWFKQDDTFLAPKANLMFHFVSPMVYLDPLSFMLSRLFARSFYYSLKEYSYAPTLAGLNWELSTWMYGLLLDIGGFSNRQHILLKKLMEEMVNIKIDPEIFEICKDNLIRTLKNAVFEQPHSIAQTYMSDLMHPSWTNEELLATTHQLTVERLEAFIPQIFSKLHIEALLYGNVNRQKACELVNIVEDHLSSTYDITALLPKQLLLMRELQLEDGCNYFYEVQNNVHKYSSIQVHYQCGSQSTESTMKLELLHQLINQQCFNLLRTEEQWGYLVLMGIRKASGVQGLWILIQSAVHPAFLDERIEAFLHSMKTHLENLNDKEFEEHKEGLKINLLDKPKQIPAQSSVYWSEITSRQYYFDRANMKVKYLHTLTKRDILNFYEELFSTNEVSKRRKIAVHVVSMVEGGAGVTNEADKYIVKNGTPIHDVTAFKRSHGMYPLVQPYITISSVGTNKCKP